MFSLLRAVLIIGAIFYYSPVRQGGEGASALDGILAWSGQRPQAAEAAPAAAAPAEASTRLESMWQALPDSAKQAVLDRIMATSGLGTVTPSPSDPAGDTLRPSDRQAPWRGEAKKSNS